jgi:hypothetical protein
MEIILQIGNQKIKTLVKSRDIQVSPHTGKELDVLTVDLFANSDHGYEMVKEFINKGKEEGIVSADEHSDTTRKWRVSNHSEHFTTGNPVHRYSIELIEKEELHIERLTIDAMGLQPYSYEEEFVTTNSLKITAKVALSRKEHSELVKLYGTGPLYIPVIRKGISEETREMRFGKPLWSEHDGTFKHGLRLLDKSYDDKSKTPGLFEPELSHIKEMLARYSGSFNELLDILRKRDYLKDDDIAQLDDAVSAIMPERLMAFYRVGDIDEYDFT